MKKVLFIIIFVTSTAFLLAQTLSLEDARVLALANSNSLAKYNLAIQGTVLNERSRVYSNLPSLSLGASASMDLWSAQNRAPIENPFDTFSVGANFGISQKIFQGGKSIFQKAINEIASESVRREAQAEYFNVIDAVDNAYYAVLEAAATLEAEEASLRTSLAGLQIAEIRAANGMINQGDYLRALAEKEARENSRNQAWRTLSLNIARLKGLTGLNDIPPLERIDFSGYEELILRLGTISNADADFVYNNLWNSITASNPSLARSSLAVATAQQNLNLSRSAYSPTLSASASTGLNYTQDRGWEHSGGRVSLNLSIPVDYWVLANNVEKSKLNVNSTALDYANAELMLRIELQTALLSTFANAGSVLSSRRALEYAEKHFEYVEERYRLSQSSITDLNEATTLLINSRNNHIKSSYGFLQGLSKLRSFGAFENEENLTKILMKDF